MSNEDHHSTPPPDGGLGDGGHGADARSAPAEFEPRANPPLPGAQETPGREVPGRTPTGMRVERAAAGILRPIQDSEIFSEDPAVVAAVSSHIDEYFNQPLDIFPFWETENKPDRFHVLFARQIEERFPVDRDLRSHIHDYGRGVFKALCVHVGIKRLTQGLTMLALAALAILGPTWFADWTGSPALGPGLAAGAMLASVGVFAALQAILFIQYRFRLENDSYELSREIVQRTRELQNLFTQARTMADQAETQFQMDGKGWGMRSHFLTRVTMWMGARMEYLEKYVQMELWRVRRERYWMRWFSRFMTPLVLILGLWVLIAESAPSSGEGVFRALQLLAAALGIAVSWMSYFLWQTPVGAIQDKLGVDGWVRYASLDVDNAVAEQVRRDKERLVEYRHLTRGRG